MAGADRKIVIWLLTGCLLVFLMVLIGGITRLTGSGLSITEWKLIHGTIPPLTDSQWEEEFDNYKQIPQFRNLNYHFSLSDFKGIYWWEYIHRLMGRIIGMVFLVPFLWFLFTGKLNRPFVIKLLFLFFLGGLQGFLGWYMVRSGLSENLHVSHFRLAIHLVTAFITFGFTLLLALSLVYKSPVAATPFIQATRRVTIVFLSLVMIQLVYGAFVAGLKAGYIYNTFPLMGDSLVPQAVPAGLSADGMGALASNKAVVQFIHRSMAWLLLLAAILFYAVIRKGTRRNELSGLQVKTAYALVFTVIVQFILGVLTLLFEVPVLLGVAHQALAFLLFAATLLFMHRLYRSKSK